MTCHVRMSSKWLISLLSAAAVPLSLAADSLPQSESSFKGKIALSDTVSVIVSHGSRAGGFVLYFKDDQVVYETVKSRSSASPIASNEVLASSMPLPRGQVEFAYEYSKE